MGTITVKYISTRVTGVSVNPDAVDENISNTASITILLPANYLSDLAPTPVADIATLRRVRHSIQAMSEHATINSVHMHTYHA
jgi:hypothetical protein